MAEAAPINMQQTSPTKPPAYDSVPLLAVTPSVGVLPSSQLHFGEWQSPLFGCFQHVAPTCLLATFLPCISMAQISHRLNIAGFGVVLLTFLAFYVFDVILLVLSMPHAHLQHMPGDGDDQNNELDVTVSPLFVLAHKFQFYLWVGAVLFVWHLRSKIRQRFEIEGSVWRDALAAFFCGCCALTQMATQVQCYEPGHCDFGPPDVLAPYET